MTGLSHFLDRHAKFWLWASVILTPALAMAGGLGFQLAGLFMGFAGLLICAFHRSEAAYLKALWPIALIAFAGWAWISTLWSVHDGDFWTGNAARLFGLLIFLLFLPAIFLRLSENQKEKLSKTMILMGFLGVIIMTIDSVSDYAVSLWVDPPNPGQDPVWRAGQAEMSVGRGQISYAQLFWPVTALLIVMLKRGWMLAGFLGIALTISAFLNDLAVVMPTLFLSSVFAFLAWKRPRMGVILAFSFTIFTLLFAPVMGILSSHVDPARLAEYPLSFEHRVRMWAYTWELIQQAPFLGHGFDASRAYNDLTFHARDGRDIVVLSLHPHNIGLQIWLETGLVGIALATFFILALMKQALRFCAKPAHALAISGLIVAIACNGAVTIGVWQHWWWALSIFLVSLIWLLPKGQQNVVN